MADKPINALIAATSVQPTDLFVLEQNSTAKKLTGQILENWLLSLAGSVGGIVSLEKTGSSGTDPVVDVYTITFSDTSTTTFTVTNGLKGDTGAQSYVYIRYASQQPTSDSDVYNIPDEWMGIYSGLESNPANLHYTDYSWYKIKGTTGNTGAAATVTGQTVDYQQSSSGTEIPSGSWSPTVPFPLVQGDFLWTRTTVTYNNATTVVSYSVGYIGLDGTGVGDMTKASYDPQGTVLAAGGIPGFVTNALPSYGSSTPEMDGTGTPGISTNVARADHVHPSDTGKADAVHASTHATAGSDPIDPDDIGAAKLDSNGKVLASEASAHIVFKSGSATLALDEAGASIFMTNSSAATITIPANSSVAFPMGTEIEIVQTDAAITFAGASGVTINSPEGALTLNSQHKSACLKKYGTDTWNLQGDLV